MEKVGRCYSGIPNHFERRLLTENKTTLSVSINAIDGAAAVSKMYILLKS
jgi:ABC-2 type transport system permease protein